MEVRAPAKALWQKGARRAWGRWEGRWQRREAEGWTQGVVCISGSDLVIGHKERDVAAGEAERAPW